MANYPSLVPVIPSYLEPSASHTVYTIRKHKNLLGVVIVNNANKHLTFWPKGRCWQ